MEKCRDTNQTYLFFLDYLYGLCDLKKYDFLFQKLQNFQNFRFFKKKKNRKKKTKLSKYLQTANNQIGKL